MLPTFTNLAKYDLAIETYLKGEQIANVKDLYVYNLADLYRRSGDTKNMIKYYLITVEKEQNSLNVQTSLQRFLAEGHYVELQRQLYEKIQEKPDVISYGELLQWSFVQKKEYGKALRQARALDRQFEEPCRPTKSAVPAVTPGGSCARGVRAGRAVINRTLRRLRRAARDAAKC